ncbi:MAG: hypothetical protein ACI35Q_05290 [Marinilabiliaceae bacterium]
MREGALKLSPILRYFSFFCMKAFSLNRFGRTLRYIGFVKWRVYANCLAVPFLVTAVTLIANGFFGSHPDVDSLASKAIFTFAMLLCASFFCVKVLYPTGRPGDEYSQFLVLPATSFEKFLAAILMRVAAPLICAAVGYYAAVLVVTPGSFLRVLMSEPTTVNGMHIMDSIPSELGMSLRIGGLILPHAFVLCSLSFFLFAGFVFARFKWILGFIVQIIIAVLVVRAVLELDDIIDFDEYDVNYTALVWWLDAILLAVTALLVFLSYRLFKRSQAVKGRFLSF